jgi:hypothetical protein
MKDAFDFIFSQSKTIVDPFQPWTYPAVPALDQKDLHTFVKRAGWTKRCELAILQQLESDNGVPAQVVRFASFSPIPRGHVLERLSVVHRVDESQIVGTFYDRCRACFPSLLQLEDLIPGERRRSKFPRERTSRQ